MSSIRWSTAFFRSPSSAADETAPVIPRARTQNTATAAPAARRGSRGVGRLVGVPAKYRSEAENLVGGSNTEVPPQGEPGREHGQDDHPTDHPGRGGHDVGHADERRVDEGGGEVS